MGIALGFNQPPATTSSGIYAPDRRIDTMELLYPKRKPVGKVKIDWSHPLSKSLLYHFDGVSDPKDATYNDSQVVTGRHSRGSNFKPLTQNRIGFDVGYNLFRRQTFTAIVRFTLPVIYLGATYIFNSDLRFNIGWGVEQLGGLGVSWYYGSFPKLDFGSPAQTTPYTIAVSRKQGVGIEAYMFVNGTKTKLTDFVNTQNIIYEYGRSASLGARNWALTNNNNPLIIHEFDYFSEALSEQEIESYVDNPYQFLIPA